MGIGRKFVTAPHFAIFGILSTKRVPECNEKRIFKVLGIPHKVNYKENITALTWRRIY